MWNLTEAAISIGLGVAAGSLALVAFGADSLIEVFASLVVVWHSREDSAGGDGERTTRSLRLIALAFGALGLILIAGAIVRLLEGTVPDESPLGIAYLALTAAVMLTLGVLKGRTADQMEGTTLESGPLRADAHVSYLDAILATLVLMSLALNAAFGWWWADPLTALAVAAIALSEGHEHWHETH